MRRIDRSKQRGTNTIEYILLTGFILGVVIASGFVPRAISQFDVFFNKVAEAMR